MSELPDLHKAMAESLPVYEAPAALRMWAIEQARAIDKESLRDGRPPTSVPWVRTRSFYKWRTAAGLLIAAAVGWGAASLRPVGGTTPGISATTNQLVDAHVRSLLPSHLLDVESTDRHTVKPWFAGKTDIAPPVVDLADKAFPLLGGRLDYVDGHSAAVLIYVWRSTTSEPPDRSFAVRGYSLLHWTRDGLSYWAVSDAAQPELEAFRNVYTR